MPQPAITFDTHRFVKHLQEGGFTEQQAETLAEEHVSLLNTNLATKADIEALRLATKADIEALRLETKADSEVLKSDLLKWMFGGFIAQGGLIVALIKFV